MIYDRTIDDVRRAIEIRTNVIQQTEILSESEKAILARGMVTSETIKRIANKQIEVRDIINRLGYFNAPIDVIECTASDVFTAQDLNRLVANNATLRKAFYVFKSSPRNAVARYHFEEFNALEKILYDLYNMTDIVKDYTREAGTFESGE